MQKDTWHDHTDDRGTCRSMYRPKYNAHTHLSVTVTPDQGCDKTYKSYEVVELFLLALQQRLVSLVHGTLFFS